MSIISISHITNYLETIAPPALQESYDNGGLLTGCSDWQCTGVICCLDAIEAVVDEAIAKKCNLIVAHHPVIFSGLKKINGKNYVERTVIKAIKHDIAIYAIHTNLDNMINGVNGMIAEKLGLKQIAILLPKACILKKLFFFVPPENANAVMDALFEAGGGHIGNYSECSFSVDGMGTFKPNTDASPYSGQIGKREAAVEKKIEILFPEWLEANLLTALKNSHPYEEVAYEIITIDNQHQHIGAGVTGQLVNAMEEHDFLQKLKEVFKLPWIKHTPFTGKKIKNVAVCGGAGSFLIEKAISSKSDAYITSDVKYHEYFDTNGRILLCDIGHYESEQFTIDLLATHLEEKFPNFAVLKTAVNTNPVCYF